jgi:competence protein ComEA
MNMKTLILSSLLTLGAVVLNPVIAQTTPVVAKVNAGTVKSQDKLSINKASSEQLVAIPGVGQKKAQAIIDYIKANGPIKDQKQLTEVKGIGEKLATKISEFVSY